MTLSSRVCISAGSLLLQMGLALAQTAAPGAAVEATGYLQAALDQIEQSARVYATDWAALRARALESIERSGALTARDTYPAIRAALVELGDPHSRLLEPADAKLLATRRPAVSTGMFVTPRAAVVAHVAAGGPAEAAGLAPGDHIVSIEGVPAFADLAHFEFSRLLRNGQRSDCSIAPLELVVRSGAAEQRTVRVEPTTLDEFSAPSGRRLDNGIAYVEVAGVSSGPRAADYDDAVHAVLRQLDDGTLRGFIVDLRRNTGGSVEPMLASIGPLAGSGKLGAYVSSKNTSEWSYDGARGAAIFEGYELAKVATPYTMRADIPVAVLTGPLTAQAGEALVVAFAGRAQSRRFGEGTRGVPFGSTTKTLSDGALLVLTVTVYSDRAGQRYEGVIPPDEAVAIDWAKLGAADDPVVTAASRWLISATQSK